MAVRGRSPGGLQPITAERSPGGNTSGAPFPQRELLAFWPLVATVFWLCCRCWLTAFPACVLWEQPWLS